MKKLLLLLLAALVMWPASSEAKVILDPGFTGTLAITMPNGELVLLEAGETIPDIPSNATIEVYGGSFSVTTHDEGDAVNVSCYSQKAMTVGGASMSLSCGDDGGVLNILKGSAQIVDASGQTMTLSEGTQYSIKPSSEKEAAPTAGGEPTGGPAAGGDLASEPPVDSRDIQSSPS